MSSGFGRALDRLTIYLPIILMGLLALGTYWLARNTPVLQAPVAESAPTHEPDYFLRGFSVKSFEPSGRLRSDIRGAEAKHFPDTDTFEIEQPRIRSYNSATGALTVASARKAIANGDGTQVQLIGDAVVTREPPAAAPDQPKLEIRGNFLHAFLDVERVRSNQPVRITRGNDRFEADNLDYDNLDRVLQLRGNVRGILQPRGR